MPVTAAGSCGVPRRQSRNRTNFTERSRYVTGCRRIALCLAGVVATGLLAGCPFGPPLADFSATPTLGDAPLMVRFAAQPREGSTPIETFLWDFGDGMESTAENPTHTYEAAGRYRVSLSVSNANGVSTETKDAFITVRAAPDAAFSATPREGNTPLRVEFRDESDTGPFAATDWEWRFGDGETSTEQNPVHEYVQPGAYTVSLAVTTEGGVNTETREDFIQVRAAPSAAFEASPTAGNLPLDVAFTDQSRPGTAEITGWFWEFGDGATSEEQNPVHQYQAAGTYSVSLTTESAVGESTRTEANLITVTERPTAAFSGTPREGGAPLVVSFTDESLPGSAPVTSWLWDFGDGTSSQQRNPIHEFADPGTYDIALTVMTDAGTDTLLEEGFVVAQAPPAADFSATPTRGEAPLSVEFQDTSDSGASPITGRQWGFGDGNVSGDERPVHVYDTPGLYTVTLRVETAVGTSEVAKQDFVEVVARPSASFSADRTSGETPLTVNFTDTSDPGSSEITAWLWEFGDGTTSEDQHPTRVYNAAGTYTVKLTVTTAEGESTVTRNNLIRVVQGPRADFSATPTTGNAPLSVQFSDDSDPGSAPVTERVWDFGDGTTSTAKDPVHVYEQPGIYTVSLTVTTEAGTDTEGKAEFVTADPDVSFTLTPATDTLPVPVEFRDTTSADPLTISAWAWEFGDGGTSDLPNPVHTYTEAGSYDVRLTVTTEQGEASTLHVAAVRLQPQAAFSATPDAGTAPLDVTFEDQTEPGNLDIAEWEWNWDFGDGNNSTERNPTHTFDSSGKFDVTLTVVTAIGDSSPGTETITVTETKTAELGMAPGTVADPSQASILFDLFAPETSGAEGPATVFAGTPDGGFVVLLPGTTAADAPLLLRFDPEGQLQWELDLAVFAFESTDHVAALADGDLVLAGASTSDGAGGSLLLVRLDGEGVPQWQRLLDDTPLIAFEAIAPGPGKDMYLLVAEPVGEGTALPVVHRLDAEGATRWRAPLPPPEPHPDNWELFPLPGGGVGLRGGTDGTVNDHADWELHLDARGRLQEL